MLINNSLLINIFTKYAEKINLTQDEFDNAKIITSMSIENLYYNFSTIFVNLPKIFKEYFSKNAQNKNKINNILDYLSTRFPKNFIINPADVFTVIYPYSDRGDIGKPKTKQSIFRFLNPIIRENILNSSAYDFLKTIEGAEIGINERDNTIRVFKLDSFIEALVNTIGNLLAKEATLLFNQDEIIDPDKYREFSGKKITEEYVDMEHSSHSCMTGNNNKFLIKLYENNPDKIKLIRYLGTRFLIWKCDDDQLALDRIYPDNHKLVPIIVSWAKKNNILTKNNPTSYDEEKTFIDNSVRFVTMSIENIEKLPYLDTFSYGAINIENNTITLTNKATDKYNLDFSTYLGKILNESSKEVYNSIGEYLQKFTKTNYSTCDYCLIKATKVYPAIYGDNQENGNICSSCYYQNFFNCNNCNKVFENDIAEAYNDGTTKNNILYCKNCFKNNFSKCSTPGCNEVSPNVSVKKIDNKPLCKNCYDDLAIHCSYCGDIINSEYCNYDDGGQYCNDCFNEKQKNNI